MLIFNVSYTQAAYNLLVLLLADCVIFLKFIAAKHPGLWLKKRRKNDI
jgi:hypothetical protein